MVEVTERCPACGAAYRENIAFCVSCGLPRPATTPAEEAAPVAPVAAEVTAPAEVAPAAAEVAPVAASAAAPLVAEALSDETAPAPAVASATAPAAAPQQRWNPAVAPVVIILAIALIVILFALARSGTIF